MVRNYKKNRAPPQTHSPATVLKAVKAVKVENKSIRHVSEDMKIPYRTLTRYCRKVHKQQLTESRKVSAHVFKPGDIAARRVFSSVEERELVSIMKKAMGTYYGMTGKQVRHLAYEAAIAFRCDFPASWIKTQQAGYDWFLDFIKRHRDLAVGTEDASLLPLSTPCCSKTIDHYSKHFKLLHDRLKLDAEDIWCMGEIAVSTLSRPHRVFARRGTRPETQMDLCNERESAVTMALCVSASGASIPPFLVVPPAPKNGASASSFGAPEWLKKSLFQEFLKHFVQHNAGCLSEQTLLLIDGHHSYFSIKAMEFCKLNGIILLAFPQHYCNTLNPLQRTLLGSVKTHINTSWDNWIGRHPDTRITVKHIPEIISPALTHITSDNIKEAFKEAGIYPLSNSSLLLAKFKKKATAYNSETEQRTTAALSDTFNLDHREATRETVFINYEEEEMDMDSFVELQDPLGDLSTVGSSRAHENFENSSEGPHEDIKVEAEDVKYDPYMIALPVASRMAHDQSLGPSSHLKNNLYFSSSERDFVKTEEVKVEKDFFKTEEVNTERDFLKTEEVFVERDFFEIEEVKVEVKEEDIDDV